MERGMLFIHSSNLFAQFEAVIGNGKVDFEKFKKWVEDNTKIKIVRIYYYVAELPPTHRNKKKQDEFLRSLESKPAFKVQRGKLVMNHGVETEKCVDVQIACDLFRISEAQGMSHAIVVSGDEDIAPAVDLIQYKGINVITVSFVRQCSKRMRDSSDRFLEILPAEAPSLVMSEK